MAVEDETIANVCSYHRVKDFNDKVSLSTIFRKNAESIRTENAAELKMEKNMEFTWNRDLILKSLWFIAFKITLTTDLVFETSHTLIHTFQFALLKDKAAVNKEQLYLARFKIIECLVQAQLESLFESPNEEEFILASNFSLPSPKDSYQSTTELSNVSITRGQYYFLLSWYGHFCFLYQVRKTYEKLVHNTIALKNTFDALLAERSTRISDKVAAFTADSY